MKHATLMAGLGCGEATGKGVLEPILDAALFLLKTFTRPSVLLLVQKLVVVSCCIRYVKGGSIVISLVPFF